MRPAVEWFFDHVAPILQFGEVVLDLARREIEGPGKGVEMRSRVGGDVLAKPVALVGHGLNSVSRETVRA